MFIDWAIAIILAFLYAMIIAVWTFLQLVWIILHAIFRTDRHKQRKERVRRAKMAKLPTHPRPEAWVLKTPMPPPPPPYDQRMGR